MPHDRRAYPVNGLNIVLFQRLHRHKAHVWPAHGFADRCRIGDGRQFKRRRQASASIEVTPRHHGTGGKNRLYGISKEGDRYLRCIIIHGARAVVSQAKHRDDPLSVWLTDLAERTQPNVAAVALANKTVRIAWAMIRNGTDYDPEFVPSSLLLLRALSTRTFTGFSDAGPTYLPSFSVFRNRV